jgi:hypothetical protein
VIAQQRSRWRAWSKGEQNYEYRRYGDGERHGPHSRDQVTCANLFSCENR